MIQIQYALEKDTGKVSYKGVVSPQLELIRGQGTLIEITPRNELVFKLSSYGNHELEANRWAVQLYMMGNDRGWDYRDAPVQDGANREDIIELITRAFREISKRCGGVKKVVFVDRHTAQHLNEINKVKRYREGEYVVKFHRSRLTEVDTEFSKIITLTIHGNTYER